MTAIYIDDDDRAYWITTKWGYVPIITQLTWENIINV